MDSILTSTKASLGIAEEYNHFDSQIISYINSVFGILNQLGVGPAEGFIIEDSLTMWTDYTNDILILELVKSYMAAKVRLLFDPPLGGTVMEALKEQIREFECRLSIAASAKEATV